MSGPSARHWLLAGVLLCGLWPDAARPQPSQPAVAAASAAAASAASAASAAAKTLGPESGALGGIDAASGADAGPAAGEAGAPQGVPMSPAPMPGPSAEREPAAQAQAPGSPAAAHAAASAAASASAALPGGPAAAPLTQDGSSLEDGMQGSAVRVPNQPGAPYAPPVMARYPDPPMDTALASLQPGRQTPTSAAELNRWLAETQALAPVGTVIEHRVAGRSVMGAPIEFLRLSRGSGRPLVLLVGQQHGNEPAGAEALLLVARDLATGALGAVLDRIDVLIVPRLNPDGAGWGSRVNGLGLDINRDHLALRSPEARALALLARDHRPLLVLDAHEYHPSARALQRFGLLMRPDLMFQYATTPNLPEALTRLAERGFRQPLLADLERAGFGMDWYALPAGWPEDARRMVMGGLVAGMARNAYGLRHAVSLLLESRGIGLAHWHLARRVQSHRVAVASALVQAAARVEELLQVQQQADQSVAEQACTGPVVVRAERLRTQRRVTMVQPDSGADWPLVVAWWSSLQLQPVVQRQRPCGYWLATDQLDAVRTLQRLGVQVRRLLFELPLQAERWVWPSVPAAPDRPGAASAPLPPSSASPSAPAVSADGDEPDRSPVPQLVAERLLAPRSSYYVSMAQPLANLVAAALEPDAPGSFLSTGVIDRLDAVRRVRVAPEPEER